MLLCQNLLKPKYYRRNNLKKQDLHLEKFGKMFWSKRIGNQLTGLFTQKLTKE